MVTLYGQADILREVSGRRADRSMDKTHRSADHHHVNIWTVHNKRMVTTMRFTKIVPVSTLSTTI